MIDWIAARHGGDDLAQNGVDDVLDVALIKVRVLLGNALHELGLDHAHRLELSASAGFICRSWLLSRRLFRIRRLPKRQ